MAKRGMGWVPDYPDVRDCKLTDPRLNDAQKPATQDSDLLDVTDDRLLQLIKIIEEVVPGSREKFLGLRKEINNKLQFLPATFIDGILSLNSEGKEVEELQKKLKELGYFKESLTKYFDKPTEEAVKKFQKVQSLSPTGVYTAITKAELLALSAIKSRDSRTLYKSGRVGLDVIYIQQILANSKYKLTIEDAVGCFEASTKAAVIEFQTKENLQADGIVGPLTREKLLKHTNKSLGISIPPLGISTLPISYEQFKQLSNEVDAVLKKAGDILKEDEDGFRTMVEVMIQLATCLGETDQFGQPRTLQGALLAAYEILEQIEGTEKYQNQTDKINFIIDWLKQQKGYSPSNILRYQDYKIGDSGSAIIYIQERLRALGYYNAPTTGYFEQLTKEAVQRFQQATIQQGNREIDGVFRQADLEILLNSVHEEFKYLEPPLLLRLVDYLTESIIELEGGVDKIISELNKKDFLKNTSEIEQSIKHFHKNRTLLADSQELDAAVLFSNSQAAQSAVSGADCTAEQSKRNAVELIKQILFPIAKVVAQIIAPISQYSSPELAFEDGFKRFKVLANYEQIRKIDRIIKGITAASDEQVDRLITNYELLIDTLTVLQAEMKQYEQLPENANPILQLKWLALEAIQNLQTFAATEITAPIKQFLLQQLVVDEDIAQRSNSTLSNSQSESPLVREQTIVRLSQACNECPIQIPVAGKLHQALSQPASPCTSLYLALPDAVDLSLWCSEVEDQGELDACTAHAGVGLIEYFEKKSFGKSIDASRRFLYKVTRNLMHRDGDTGASVRETMKAMVLFGVPPEEYCPYDEAAFDEDPSAFCYAFAQNYQAIRYFRLDGIGVSTKELLAQIKTMLVTGFPCMFGFTVYSSIHDPTNPPGHIPYPDRANDKQEGGHAAIVVGYNDYKRIKNAEHPGALLIKNSWGKAWGAGGYGWLPYDYVLSGLARDWWSLIKSEWVESKKFGLGSSDNWESNLGRPDGKPPH